MKTKKSPARSKRKKSSSKPGPIRPAAHMPLINAHAAGIDVGATEHYVCVAHDAVGPGESPVRRFGAFTGELDKLVEWLQLCGVQTVALESTGVYWIGLAQKLEEAGLEMVLVNARHLRYVPGRKTDVKDCQWLQQLHSYGLLNASFRPAQAICCLRSLTRHRENLTHSSGREVQHMQKALQQMNIHLHHVVSDLNGQTGLRIVDAILAGQRDPKELVQLRDQKCSKSTPEEMEAALQGDWRQEHLFVLNQALQTYRHLGQQLEQCDQEIENLLANMVMTDLPVPAEPAAPNPPATTKKRRKKVFHKRNAGTALKRDLTSELKRLCGVDLTQIIGLNVLGVLIILSEIGVDMSRWRNAKAFCSWLGLSPGNKISGGKVLNSATSHVVNRVSILLRTVAPSVGRSDTFLGAFHRRMKARLGPAAANTATARKLACLIYHLIQYKEEYIDVDQLVFELKLRQARLNRLRKQAKELGFQLVENQQAA